MRFVALWLQFKERGLALYRELGTMPYDNWEAFYRSFLPEAGRPAEGEKPHGPSTQTRLPGTPRPAYSGTPPPPPSPFAPPPRPKPD